jgi:murein DD-endopeptidase MepM/ murein hydrolase activator NlpD
MKFRVEKLLMVAQMLWSSAPKKPLAAVAVLFALPTFGIVTAFGIAPDTSLEKLERREVSDILTLPDFSPTAAAVDTYQHQDRVQRGDSVAAILARLNVRDSRAFEFLRRDPIANSLFRQLRPGKTIQAHTTIAGELQQLRYYLSTDKYLDVTRTADGFAAVEKSYAAAAQQVFKSASIRSSLFAASDGAGIPDAVAIQIARIFSTDIDFHIDLRKGDRFSVVYEMHYENGELVRPGEVLYAEFVNDGRTYEAFRFSDDEGGTSYYSRDGQNRAKSFLRSPLEFSRVSSGFGSRFHPIFKNWRAHTGVDFAAPKGTRIWATADGVVETAGVKGGYGNCIEVRHSGGITTLYGHLSGFAAGVKRGSRVKQGDVIGYVGATGYATGPHLHYEFKVSGIHQNPMRVALPKAEPLPARLKPAFESVAAFGSEYLAQLRNSSFGRFE